MEGETYQEVNISQSIELHTAEESAYKSARHAEGLSGPSATLLCAHCHGDSADLHRKTHRTCQLIRRVDTVDVGDIAIACCGEYAGTPTTIVIDGAL